MIPPQLQNAEFRLIKVAPKSKRPIEPDWQESANYPFDSPELRAHMERGGNYGIICGPGGIRILDCDELSRLEELGVLAKFPKTFSVQSRPGRIHRYYMIPELKKRIVLFDPILKDDNGQPLHLGEIQGPGTQIIGPGSIHQMTGKPYEVIDDSPIAALSMEQVKDATEGLKTSRLEDNCARLEAMPKRAVPQKDEDPFRHIRIDDIAYPSGETRRIGDEIQGAHPLHGSTTGKNFRIDLKKNTWYCDRCRTGGGPALWLAVKNGIIRCDQASAGSLRGDDFKKVWRIAENEGLIAKQQPTFKKLEKKEVKDPEITLDDVSDVEIFNAGKDNERIERTFSPDKAADAIIQALHIVSTPDEKIWIYQDGYYRNDGAVVIDRKLDRIAGDLYTIRASKEVQKKIFLRTMTDYSLFDQDPYLLCVKNGVVNLLEGTFSDHNPNYYLTTASSVNYNPDARPVIFLKFLKESCSNDDDRVTLIDWMVACAILVEFEYLLFLTGHGANGKHVYEALLQALFGSESTEAISLEELMNSKFAMGYLRRARLCISSETNPDKTKTELIKKISGNDWLSSDVKNKDRVRFKAFCQLLFDSNSMPIFEDTSYGFTRRFTRVNMPYKFVDCPDPNEPLQKLKDPHLLEKLMSEDEMSGILNLIIYRAKEIAKDKKIHRRENDFEKYEEQSYSINDFMEKFVEFNPEYRDMKDFHESADFIFSKFEEYTKYMIGAKASRKKFSILLGKENGEPSRTVRPTRDGFDGLAVRGFRGLKFDLDTYSSFIEEKKKEYSCNACNDRVTDGGTDVNIISEDNVTLVTIFSRILYTWDKGPYPQVVRGQNATSLQIENPIENGPTDIDERMEESCNGSVTTLRKTKDSMCMDCNKLLTISEVRVHDGLDYCPGCYAKETAKPKEISFMTKAIEILQKHCTPISPFVLAVNAENYGVKLTPKQCEAWMKAHGWIQEAGKWQVSKV